jgi:hypothetical protein
MSFSIIGDELFFDGQKVGDISPTMQPSIRAAMEDYVLRNMPQRWSTPKTERKGP